MSEDKLIQKIEAVLFWKGEPVLFSDLSKIINQSEENTRNLVNKLKENLLNRGLSIVVSDQEAQLVISPDINPEIQELIKKEREGELGKAGIETLAIISYRGPISRGDIEYIRGVNCQFAIRNLMIRGLIEKKVDKNDNRKNLYYPTIEALRFLGITDSKELPEYIKVNEDIEGFIKNSKNQQDETQQS